MSASTVFTRKIPGQGRVELENVLALRPGPSNQVIVVVAHRDNSGAGPGANDNASGTAALLLLAPVLAVMLVAIGAQNDAAMMFCVERKFSTR